MVDTSSGIWDKIAEIYQDKFEKAVGDTANLLWVAMRSGGRLYLCYHIQTYQKDSGR